MSLRQIDQDDVRILPDTVEHDLLPVGRDVERLYPAAIAEARERASLVRGEIEQPEIAWVRAWHVHQTRSIRQEAMRTAQGGLHFRQIDAGPVRSDCEEWHAPANSGATVHDQVPARRPGWVDELPRHKTHGCDRHLRGS